MARGWGGDWYEPSVRREVKGGIKAQTKGGAFGKSWWAKRWIAVLESFDLGSRLTRGRSYARSGQVVSIDIKPGEVVSKVQGSRPTPYNVTIQVKTLGDDGWKKVGKGLAAQPLYAARLLAGEMPQDIETVFQQAGVSLFPDRMADITTNCSCPDWSNPCKHIAAVYYLLGEEFDRDPFLIFKLRGITREELVGLLGPTKAPSSPISEEPPTPPEPLEAAPNRFWNTGSLQPDFFGEVRSPPINAALPRRLGSFPFWRATTPFLEAMERDYQQASLRGLNAFTGEPETQSAPAPTAPGGGDR